MTSQPSLFDPPAPRLKPQAMSVLRLLVERGSLTPLEARELVGTDRLAARILEIKRAYGEGRITTTTERTGRKSYARYVWNRAA